MKINKTSFFLILILSVIALTTTIVTLFFLYRDTVNLQEEYLQVVARSQAEIIKSVAKFDQQHSQEDHELGFLGATLSQVEEAYQNFSEFGETGEITLGIMQGDNFRFMVKRNNKNLQQDTSALFHMGDENGIPMQNALLGKSGIVIGNDLNGILVLAAVEPLKELNSGLVAKIAMSEVQQPFIEAGLYSLLIVGILVFLGSYLFIRINNHSIARLKNSEAYNRMLFDTSPVGLALCKLDGTLVDLNRSYADILGRDIKETKSLSYWEITPEEYADQEQQQLEQLDKTNHYGPYEKEYIHKSGKKIPVSLIGQFIEREGEKYIWSAVEDITYRREAESKINKLNTELEERVKIRTRELEQTLKELKETQSHLLHSEKMASLGQLTAGIGHEINNPVNFIDVGIHSLESNLAEIMQVINKYGDLDHSNIQGGLEEIDLLKNEIGFKRLVEFVNKNIGNIKNGVSRTVEIIEALKTYSREDREKFSFIEIHENIESTLVMLHSKYGDKIKIEKKYGILPEVACLPGGINQILTNIISNSIDAIFEHKKNGEGKIVISTMREKDSAVIEIEDNGIGIPNEKIDAIFDPFYTTKEVGKGTGLGLSICYNIIQRHQGELKVKSYPGKGTNFKIVLPLKQF